MPTPVDVSERAAPAVGAAVVAVGAAVVGTSSETSQAGPAQGVAHRMHSQAAPSSAGAASRQFGTSSGEHSRQTPSPRGTAGQSHAATNGQASSSCPSKEPSPQLRAPLHLAAASTQCPYQPVAVPSTTLPHRRRPPPDVPGRSFQPSWGHVSDSVSASSSHVSPKRSSSHGAAQTHRSRAGADVTCGQ